jgi:DNA invertase Pin-like site-specific DNA recombinase
MTTSSELKVTARHLARTAYLYVRQSSLRQVLEHTESTARQYALRQRAVALGWPAEQIVVIDCDQGQSGASAVDRAGFQQLVAEVGLGHAGIVLVLEVSRRARSSTDWHRLLELCALSNTLILDEDGLYDPSQFNDRLLLGLKGTMSEAELHVLRARLIGGVLNKARRGELKIRLPVGLAYDPLDRVVRAPAQQVQHAVRLRFTTFQRAGSASATVRAFRTGAALPAAADHGFAQGRAGLGSVAVQPRAPYPAQPSLCRRLRLRSPPDSPDCYGLCVSEAAA